MTAGTAGTAELQHPPLTVLTATACSPYMLSVNNCMQDAPGWSAQAEEKGQKLLTVHIIALLVLLTFVFCNKSGPMTIRLFRCQLY